MKSTQILLVATVLLGVLWPRASGAQNAPPRLDVTVDPTSITLGDPVTVAVTITHPLDTHLIWPDPVELAPFELLAMTVTEPVVDNDRLRSTAELAVTTFELGELTVPTFLVQVVSDDETTDPFSLSTNPAVITVTSVGRDDSGDIRDIKGPLTIPFQVITLLPWVIGIVMGGAALYWLVRRYYFRRPTSETRPAPPPPARPADEVAYESLLALELSGLLTRGEVKTYHIRLSDIMRVYVEGRFNVQAMEMTTGEVLAGLRTTGTRSDVVGRFRQLLDRCDLVKFAKHRPEPTDCHDLVGLGRGLVDVTTLAAVPSPNTEASPTQERVA